MYFRQFSDARDNYKDLIKALDVAKVDREKKMKIQNETQRSMEYFQKAKSVYNDPKVPINPPPDLPKISGKNQKYPAVSDAIQFR